ncbi:MAG TPA: MATE family efflux transporter, partial [Candidatus Polarisedimenticolia bacterium]|nr:MATE family efflux transporter [Candidatus Polarisedimenticolia bacterium]
AILSLAVPAAVTYALMAAESSLVNALLARLDRATEAIAAYSIYFRVLLLSVMPVMAASVAMLPYAARRFGAHDTDGVRRGLREAGAAAALYSVALVAPLVWLLGPVIASSLAEAEQTARYTLSALRAVPLACLAMIPFILIRPVFEAMPRGRPGLAIALLRYAVLTVPCALGGAEAARAAGIAPFLGLIAGLIAASATASVVFAAWVRSALRAADHGSLRAPIAGADQPPA